MDKIINLQKEIQKVIEKAFNNFKKSPKERITVEYVETRLELLESNWQSFVDNHQKLYESSKPDEINASIYVNLAIYDKTEDNYVCYKSLLKSTKNKLITPKTDKPQHNPSTSSSDKQSVVKLPRILIPIFTGKYSEWTTFRDLFISLIHKNESLDKVQKLHYLKGYLGGEAAQLVRHTPITDANYDECWGLLEKRYDNKKYLSNCILRRLFAQRRMSVESASGLKDLLDVTIDCLNALKNLGINVSTWDIIVIHVVTYKLDSETRKQWELFISSDDSLPTIDQFKSFIERRFRALEFIEPRKLTQFNAQNQNTKVLLATKYSKVTCEYCSQTHKLCFCKKFAEQTLSQRRDFVANNKICFNCLGSNHISYDCKKSSTCRICHKKHHTMLHSSSSQEHEVDGNSKQQNENVVSSENDSPIVSCLSRGHLKKPKQVLLATALVKAEGKNGLHLLVRALIDQGSQACFITEATVQHLRLKKIRTNAVISGLSNDKTMRAQYKVRLPIQSRVDPNFKMVIEAYVLTKITAYLPENKIDAIDWIELDHLQLADPQYNVPNRIDILLGADVYGTIMKEEIKKCSNESLIAQRTTLGWILSGVVNKDNGKDNDSAMRVRVMHAQVNDNEILKKFWEIEESTFYSTKKILSEEEQKCEEIYKTTTKRSKEGRYIVNLPFRDENPRCTNDGSRDIAVKRLISLERRLGKNTKLQVRYNDVLKEYLQLGHMRLISGSDNLKQKAVYLPHHAVIREDRSTTRVRVVFNASESNKQGVSLNDTLMVGPTLQADLRHIVLNWRTYPIVLIADIVKMYRQVMVAETDANMYQRIVWRDDPKDEVKDYELLTVTFGTAAAPYLAVRTLHQVTYDYGDQYPRAMKRVLNCFYMDDLMTGCCTVQEGFEIYKEISELLNKGGFKLQKWNSNNEDLRKQIELCTQKFQQINLTKSVKNLVKQHIHRCVTCVKNSALTHNQFMGSLPSVRCTPARPFLNSGVDYAGPIYIRTTKGRGHHAYKGYICLFICMSTKAVHLEVVSDMTSQAFLAAFRRFVSRRGKCANLWSDNGTTFVGADKELKELTSIQPDIAEHLEKNGTEWHFIPPRAPNFGGLWEAAVKATKFHLKRAIGELKLTYEEMSTLLAQVEACLNSRPITVINCDDPKELLPLTPAHFLVGEPLIQVPDISYDTSNISLLSRWQLVQKTLQSFWKRWAQEYLVTLMQRYKWSRQIPEPKIGDVVLIKEDDLPPGQWLLGRVVEKHQGADQITRVVTLRTKSYILKRPTSKLCILPVDDN